MLVAPAGRFHATDRGPRAAGRRGEAGVGSEVGGGGEATAVADIDEDAGSGPDLDARHRSQDLGKRVGLQEFLSSPLAEHFAKDARATPAVLERSTSAPGRARSSDLGLPCHSHDRLAGDSVRP